MGISTVLQRILVEGDECFADGGLKQWIDNYEDWAVFEQLPSKNLPFILFHIVIKTTEQTASTTESHHLLSVHNNYIGFGAVYRTV